MVDTNSYLMLGLAVVAVILGGYVLSMVVRLNQSRKTSAALEALEE